MYDLQLEDAAAALESLGNPTRLSVFRLLIKAGVGGMAVGEIQSRLSVPGSTLSHHITHLVHRDLVDQKREGRILRCTANYARMNSLIQFLTEECCNGFPQEG